MNRKGKEKMKLSGLIILALMAIVLLVAPGGVMAEAIEGTSSEESESVITLYNDEMEEITVEELGISSEDFYRALLRPDIKVNETKAASFVTPVNQPAARSKLVLVDGLACVGYNSAGICTTVIARMSYKGKEVFCIQATKTANFDDKGAYVPQPVGKYLSSSQERAINRIGYGYSRLNKSRDTNYIAAQLAIWKTTDNFSIADGAIQSVYLTAGGWTNTGTAYGAQTIKDARDRLTNSISKLEPGPAPSYNGKTYELELNKPFLIPNPNGRAPVNPKVSAPSGLRVVKKGNSYEVTLTRPLNEGETIQLRVEDRVINDIVDRPLFVYGTSNSSDQAVAIVDHPELDPGSSKAEVRFTMKTGGFGVQKVDQYGSQAMPGFTFQISEKSDFSTILMTKTTGATGKVNFPGLTMGKKYYVRETAGPDGYLINSKVHTITMDASLNNTRIEHVNRKGTRRISVYKRDDGQNPDGNIHHNQLLDGATIEVTKSGSLYAKGKTGGHYYKLGNESTTVSTATYANQTVRVFGSSSTSGAPLFSVTSDAQGVIDITPGRTPFQAGGDYYVRASNNILIGRPKPTSAANLKGRFDLSGIDYGETLKVCETEAPATHSNKPSNCTTVSTDKPVGGIPSINFTNGIKTGSYEIQKQNQFGNLNEAGFGFEVATDRAFTNIIARASTDGSGKVKFGNLPIGGTYYYRETSSNPGHILNGEIKSFTLGGSNKNGNFVNAKEMRSVYASKKDDGQVPDGNVHHNKFLNGAEMEVSKGGALYAKGKTGEQHYKLSNEAAVVGNPSMANAQVKVYDNKNLSGAPLFSVTATNLATIEVTPGKTPFQANKQYYIADNSGLLVGQPKVKSNDDLFGRFELGGVLYGDNLTICEVKAPATHESKPNYCKNVSTNKPQSSIENLAFENRVKTGGFRLQKQDHFGNLPEAGYKFELALDRDFNKIIQTGQTNAQGYADFENLPIDMTYYYREINTLTGHIQNPNVFSIYIREGDKPTNNLKNLVNAIELRRIEVIKYDDGTIELGNDFQDELLNEAVIEVVDKSGKLYAKGETGEQHYKVKNEDFVVGTSNYANKTIEVFDNKKLQGNPLFSVKASSESTIEITPEATPFEAGKSYYLSDGNGKLIGQPKPISLEDGFGVYHLGGIYFHEELDICEVKAPPFHLDDYDNCAGRQMNQDQENIEPIVFYNTRRNGELIIHKLDEFMNLGHPGQVFEIAQDEDFTKVIGQWEAEESGIIVIDKPIAEGTYYMREIENTEHYIPTDKVYTFKVRNGFVEKVEFVNDNTEVEVELEKLDSETDEKLNGAIFTVYDTTNAGCLVDENHNIAVYDRDRETPYDFESAKCVEDKNYEGEKIFAGKTGSQYIKVYDPTIHRKPGAYLEVVIAKDKELSDIVEVLKADELGVVDITHLEEAPGTYYYGLKDVEGEVGEEILVYSAENIKGRLIIPGKLGNRTLTACETAAPYGYNLPEEGKRCQVIDVEVEHTEVNKVPKTFLNDRTIVEVTVLKKDHYDKEQLLNKATFQVWQVDSEGDKFVGEYMTGALVIKKGELLDMSSLNLEEDIEGNESPALETVVQPIEGVGFNIYKADSLDDLIDTSEGENHINSSELLNIKPEYYFETNEDGEIIEIIEPGTYFAVQENAAAEDGSVRLVKHEVKEGAIYLPALLYGQEYKLCEVMAPKGYELPGDNCKTIRVTGDNPKLAMTVNRTNKLKPTPAMREEDGNLPSITPFWY